MKEVKLTKEDFDRFMEVSKELALVQQRLQNLQQTLTLLQQQLWYTQGKRDQVLIELGRKYDFDPRGQFALDESEMTLRILDGASESPTESDSLSASESTAGKQTKTKRLKSKR